MNTDDKLLIYKLSRGFMVNITDFTVIKDIVFGLIREEYQN